MKTHVSNVFINEGSILPCTFEGKRRMVGQFSGCAFSHYVIYAPLCQIGTLGAANLKYGRFLSNLALCAFPLDWITFAFMYIRNCFELSVVRVGRRLQYTIKSINYFFPLGRRFAKQWIHLRSNVLILSTNFYLKKFFCRLIIGTWSKAFIKSDSMMNNWFSFLSKSTIFISYFDSVYSSIAYLLGLRQSYNDV